jgi:hypothetical protein
MPEVSAKTSDPPPVRLGRLRNKSDARCASRRVANAVLAGKLDEKKGNCALYAISIAVRTMEMEVSVKMEAPTNTATAPPLTTESILVAYHTARRLPAPQPAPATIARPATQSAPPQPIAAPAPPVQASEPHNDPPAAAPQPAPRAPRTQREEPVIDAEPDTAGVWSAPALCGRPHPQAAHLTCQLGQFHAGMHSAPASGVMWS